MTPKKSRFFTCLGCVVAGPLGCLAFLGGGALVGIYLLPGFAEDRIERELSRGFREIFEGDLDVGSLELSWTSTVKIDDLVLRDPEGRLVLRADLRLPPLLDYFDESELGEVGVELDVHLVVDEGGRTNLARAFEPRPGADVKYGWSAQWEEMTRVLFGRRGSLEISLREFELVSPATRGSLSSDAPMRFSDVETTLVFGTGEPLDLHIVGSTGEGTLALEAALAREAFEPTGGGDPGITGRFHASRVPTELVAAFCDAPERLRALFGARMDVLAELDPFTAGGAPLRAKLTSDGVELELEGTLGATGLCAVESRSASLALGLEVRLPPSVVAECSNGLVLVDWLGGDEPIRVGPVELAWSSGEALTLAGDGFRVDVPPLALRHTGDGLPVALRSAKLVGSRAASAAWSIRGELAFDLLAQFDPLRVELTSPEPLRVLARDPTATFALSADGHVPLAELDRLTAFPALPEGALARAFGESGELHFGLAAGSTAWPLELSIQSEKASLKLEGACTASPFAVGDFGSALDFEASLEGMPGSILTPLLPPGVTIDWSGPGDPFSIENQVTISYAGWRVRDAAASPAIARSPDPSDEGNARAGGSVTISAAHLELCDASLASRGLALELVDAVFSAHGDALALAIDVTAEFGEGRGPVEAHWSLHGLSGPFGLAGCEGALLHARARGAPTALLDAKFAAGGALSAVFGRDVLLELDRGRSTAQGAPVRLTASSGRATGELTGFHERGEVISGAHLSLDCELDEATFARVVAPLVPLLASARPAHAEGRFQLVLADGVVPLDGDVRRFDGTCQIDLAGAGVALAPELLAFLVVAADGEVIAAVPEPIVLRLADGRVSPQALLLPLPGGQSFSIEGDFGLDGSDFDLQTELPLSMLGPEVSPVLHGMSGLLRPEMGVPVVVRGSLGELSMSVRPQWIRTVTDVLGELVPDVLKESLKKLLSEGH